MELCSRKKLLGMTQSLTSVRNRKNYDFISVGKTQLVLGFLGEPQKQNLKGLIPKIDNIMPIWMDGS